MSVNKVTLLGNLGKEVEHRFLKDGGSVCNLRLATSEVHKNQAGERVELTEWHDVVVFGKTAEVCSKKLVKGDKVFVEGKLRTRKWTDKNNMQRTSTEIIANTIEFFSKKQVIEETNTEYEQDQVNE